MQTVSYCTKSGRMCRKLVPGKYISITNHYLAPRAYYSATRKYCCWDQLNSRTTFGQHLRKNINGTALAEADESGGNGRKELERKNRRGVGVESRESQPLVL